MTSKELNLKLKEHFLEIKDKYINETEWQDGDDTGSHVVYEDIFVPFLKSMLNKQDNEKVKKCFDFIENILTYEDKYANEVIAYSVIESLIFDPQIKIGDYIKFAGKKTLTLIKEILTKR